LAKRVISATGRLSVPMIVERKMSEKNAWFKRVYEHFVAFRGDQYLWNQVADHTMDTYMIRFRQRV